MKKSIRFKGLVCLFVFSLLAVNLQITFGQAKGDQASPIPENIDKIFQASCWQCHGVNGKMLPKTKLDFSKWAEYGAVKEAEKAAKICSVLTEEIMPPKSVRKSNPELIPTKEQVELICKWAESLKSKGSEK
jgi:cytochrome c5